MIDSIIAAIENEQLDEAINMLKRIKDTNRGHNKLGHADAVVITHPAKTSEGVIETVTYYAAAFGGGDRSAANLRICSLITGSNALKVMPEWFKTQAGWLGRDQFTELMYHTLVEADLREGVMDDLPLPYTDEEGATRERLLFLGEIKSIVDPISAEAIARLKSHTVKETP